MNHLRGLLVDFGIYYNQYGKHMILDGTTLVSIHCEQHWRKPDRAAKVLSGTIERRHFPDTRTMAYRLTA